MKRESVCVGCEWPAFSDTSAKTSLCELQEHGRVFPFPSPGSAVVWKGRTVRGLSDPSSSKEVKALQRKSEV